MGIIKAALTAASSTMADQWLEYYVCESMPADVLLLRAKRQTGKNSSNTKGSDKLISDGSKIVVNEGQAMIMVEQGVVTEIATDPGVYTYNSNELPSLFSSSFGKGVVNTFKEMWERFKFGGNPPTDQRIYYFNTKDIIDNRFGTQNPVPFRVNYEDIGRKFTVNVRCNGTYTFKITDPVLFYSSLAGNVSDTFKREAIDPQIRSEFLDALQPAFAEISSKGITYDQIAGENASVKSAIKTALTGAWNARGITLLNVFINSSTISEADLKRIQEYEDKAWNRDPSNAAAILVEAQAEAMKTAAGNAGGAAMGFFGMNMAQQTGGLNAQNLYAMGAAQQQQQQQNAASGDGAWQCGCGTSNTGKFCANCGKPKPLPANTWKCACGSDNTGKFCANCGKARPADTEGWVCSCGAVNKGKFCAECGKQKPAGMPLYRCDKCGWEPDDPMNPPKFCAECGDPFDDSDVVK